MRDFGAGILSECLPLHITKISLKGAGLGAGGYKALARCPQLQEIDGIQLDAFTESCTSLDLSAASGLDKSSGAVAFVIARTKLVPNLSHMNLSGANLTSKSHPHVLTLVVGGSGGIGCNGGCDARSFEGTNAYATCEQCDLDFCSTCCMSECPMVSLAESLDWLPHLVSLNISDCAFQGGRLGPVRSHLDEEGYRVLGLAMARHNKLTELDLSGNFFRGPGFPHLLRGVAQMPALSRIKLNSTNNFKLWIGAEVLRPDSESTEPELLLLALSLRRNMTLRLLDLSEINESRVKLVMTQALVESLAGRQPDTGGNQVALENIILPGGIELPLQGLQMGTVADLSLRAATRQSRSAFAPIFAHALSLGRQSLTNVDFSNNDFDEETEMIVDAVMPLTEAKLRFCNGVDLHSSRMVENLNLENMPIMPHGICILATASLKMGCVVSLNLSHCGLDATSMSLVLTTLLKKRTMRSLDVSGNVLRKEGLNHLAEFLRADRRLEALCAQNVSDGRPSSWLELSHSLEANVTLVTLDLRGNALGTGVAERLRRTMEERRSTVPMSLDLKVCILLCNRKIPYHLQLPEMHRVADVSKFFALGAGSPLFLIFQFCGQARELLIDEETSRHQGERETMAQRLEWWHPRPMDTDSSHGTSYYSESDND